MIEVIVSIGSNCGDKEKSVRMALKWLTGILENSSESEIYITPAAGNSTGEYANCVVKGEYCGDYEELNGLLKVYEENFGRDANCRKNGMVPIDIDIVMASGEIVKPWDYRQEFFQTGYRSLMPVNKKKEDREPVKLLYIQDC